MISNKILYISDQYKLNQHTENNPNGRGGKRCLPVSYTCPHCPRDFNRKRHMELHVLFKHTQVRSLETSDGNTEFETSMHFVNNTHSRIRWYFRLIAIPEISTALQNPSVYFGWLESAIHPGSKPPSKQSTNVGSRRIFLTKIYFDNFCLATYGQSAG